MEFAKRCLGFKTTRKRSRLVCREAERSFWLVVWPSGATHLHQTWDNPKRTAKYRESIFHSLGHPQYPRASTHQQISQEFQPRKFKTWFNQRQPHVFPSVSHDRVTNDYNWKRPPIFWPDHPDEKAIMPGMTTTALNRWQVPSQSARTLDDQ